MVMGVVAFLKMVLMMTNMKTNMPELLNHCPAHNIDCPYALSDKSPLPCFGTQEQCDEYRKPKTLVRQKVMADDINSMLGAMIDTVMQTISLTDAEQDELLEELQVPMEKFFGYPEFRHYN